MNKVQIENNRRLEILYKKSHNWLIAVAYNLCKDSDTAEELVGELYLYLAEKCNPSIWYLDSFNLMYAHSFISSRFYNKVKVDKRKAVLSDSYDTVDTEYDTDSDERLEEAYERVIDELKALERTKMWASSKLYQLYAFDKDMTLEKLAKELQLSKSTVYLHTKKTKAYLKCKIKSPFKTLPD